MVSGGYADGYRNCPCFWGAEPASYVRRFVEIEPNLDGRRVLDLGCGEGKNARFCAQRGARVDAIDISPYAIGNARIFCSGASAIRLAVADARAILPPYETYDVVIAYGVFHCMPSPESVAEVVDVMRRATRPGGYNIVCAFNAGVQDLSAHPGFQPLLLSHDTFLEFYRGWSVISSSDAVIRETHPHNGIEHEHALTRMLLRKLT